MEAQPTSLRILFELRKGDLHEQIDKAKNSDYVLSLIEETFEGLRRTYSTQRAFTSSRRLATHGLNAAEAAIIGAITAVIAEVRYRHPSTEATPPRVPAAGWAALIRVVQLCLALGLFAILLAQQSVSTYLALVMFGLLLGLEVVRVCLGISAAQMVQFVSEGLRLWLGKRIGDALTARLVSTATAADAFREEAVSHKRVGGELLVTGMEKMLAEIDDQVTEHERMLTEQGERLVVQLPADVLKWLQRLTGAQRLNNTERCYRLIDEELDTVLESLTLEARDFHPETESGENFHLEPSSRVSNYVTVLPALFRRGEGRLLQGVVSAPLNGGTAGD
jgi:hypothetical protein